MDNNLAVRNNLGGIIYTPSFLIIASTVRLVISIDQWWIDSLENCHYLTLFVCLSTWIIWQCYFANSVASAQTFYSKWRNFATWQRWLFGAAGLLLLLVTLAVGVGLLQVADGPSPSPLLQVGMLTPAVLWVIPVVLSAALAIFGINGNGPVEQMRDRALSHVVHLILYFVFLRSSQLDALLGAGSISVCAMFGVTFLGFILQLLWRVYPYMLTVVFKEQAAYLQQEVDRQQEGNRQQEVDPQEEVNRQQRSMSPSELVLSPIATPRAPAGHELVTPPPHKPPKLSDTDKLVIRGNKPVPLMRIPDSVSRSPSHVHSFVSQ